MVCRALTLSRKERGFNGFDEFGKLSNKNEFIWDKVRKMFLNAFDYTFLFKNRFTLFLATSFFTVYEAASQEGWVFIMYRNY